MSEARHLSTREGRLQAAFEAHQASVNQVAARILGDPASAADVCQEAFVRYFQQMDAVDAAGPWLRTVARRLALDRYRWRARRARVVESAARERSPGPSADPSEVVAAAETHGQLHAALDQLPSRQREAVVARLLAGQTFPSVARALGISEGSAKTHVRRGLQKLRDLLRPVLGLAAPSAPINTSAPSSATNTNEARSTT